MEKKDRVDDLFARNVYIDHSGKKIIISQETHTKKKKKKKKTR